MAKKLLGRETFESFDGLVFGEAEIVVGIGHAATAILGALPEFAPVTAREEREVDLIEFPLRAGAAVEPELGLPHPGLARAACDGLAQDMQTQAVPAVRVIEIDRRIDQVRADVLQHALHDVHVGRGR